MPFWGMYLFLAVAQADFMDNAMDEH